MTAQTFSGLYDDPNGAERILLQPSPNSTTCTESTTSGVSFSIGGGVGWNETQGANASLTTGVTISNSQTLACPAVNIVNQAYAAGQTQWTYTVPNNSQAPNYYGGTLTMYNQWIWEVPFSNYRSGETSVQITSSAAPSRIPPRARDAPGI